MPMLWKILYSQNKKNHPVLRQSDFFNGRTCKQVAPKLMQKYLKSNDTILDEYERAKNRNYKRVERFENKLSDKPHGKDLLFSRYDSWMLRMSSAKTMYLQGKLNADKFLKLIHELN